MDKDRKQFYRFPSDFMKGIFLNVHLFDNPENDDHPEFINYEMKHDLFHRTYDRISRIEYAHLKEGEEWFKLKGIQLCSDEDEDGFLQTLYRKRNVDVDDEQITCEKWTINISDKREESYKVRFYQSKLDRFFFLIYPPSLKKFSYDYWHNVIM